MEEGPKIVLEMLLHWLVVGVIYSLAIQFCIAKCMNSGRKGSEGNMYITPQTCISPHHPRHPRGSLILEHDFVLSLLILESKREQTQMKKFLVKII